MNNTKREIYELRTCIYMKNEVKEKEREREREREREGEGGTVAVVKLISLLQAYRHHVLEILFFGRKMY